MKPKLNYKADKMSVTIQITEESAEQLQALAKRWDKSQEYVLEALIGDRFSVSDSKRNRERRNKRYEEWMAKLKHLEEYPVSYIFHSGYAYGWIDFQIRHKDTDPVIDPPETEPA